MYSGMRTLHRKLSFSSLRQLPVRKALHAQDPTLFDLFLV